MTISYELINSNLFLVLKLNEKNIFPFHRLLKLQSAWLREKTLVKSFLCPRKKIQLNNKNLSKINKHMCLKLRLADVKQFFFFSNIQMKNFLKVRIFSTGSIKNHEQINISSKEW